MRAATRARRWFEGEPVSPASSGADASARGIFVRADYKMVRLLLDDILYIEGMKDYVRIHTQQEPVTTQMSMKAIEESLPDGQFVRVHRSYIVNIDKVRTIDRNRIVFDRVYIPISDMYREHFMQLLSKHSLLL